MTAVHASTYLDTKLMLFSIRSSYGRSPDSSWLRLLSPSLSHSWFSSFNISRLKSSAISAISFFPTGTARFTSPVSVIPDIVFLSDERGDKMLIMIKSASAPEKIATAKIINSVFLETLLCAPSASAINPSALLTAYALNSSIFCSSMYT